MRAVKTADLYYLCAKPKGQHLDVGIYEKRAGHVFCMLNKSLVVWPSKLSPEYCNPKNIHAIKSLVKKTGVVIIDRIKSEFPKVNIGGHVNRSGENYLIGTTPHDNQPRFPDMTNIYLNNPKQETKTVHTIGPKRFKKAETNRKIIWSEAVGLVAPVFHYIGFNTKGIGFNNMNSLKRFFG